MKENGVPSPEEMAMIPLDKIREIIDPDAVLYMTVVNWGTKYHVIDSVTTVHVRGQLVDAATGIVLWKGEHAIRQSSSASQSGIIEMLVAALINQIVNSFVDPSRDVAAMTNTQMFYNQYRGLLLGERHVEYEIDQQKHREQQNKAGSKSSDQ